MKLVTIAAIIAAASAGSVYHQPSLQYQPQLIQQVQSDQYQGHANQHQTQITPEQEQAYEHAVFSSKPVPKILNFISETDGHGYKYAYETENGIKVQENGHTGHGTAAQGAYSYKGADGRLYTISYTADENGFMVHGDHLPTPPPLSEEIAKALEQNAREEAAGIFDDGSYKHHQSGVEGNGYQAHGVQELNSGYQAVGYQANIAHTVAEASNAYQGHH